MRREWRVLTLGTVAAESLALTAAFALAAWTRFLSDIVPYTSPYDLAEYASRVALLLPLYLGLFWAHNLYDPEVLLGGAQQYAKVVQACTYGLIGLVLTSFFMRDPALSRGWVLISWGASILLVGSVRFVIRRVVHRLWRRGLFLRRALVVGASEQGLAIARQLHPSTRSGIEVLGFLDEYSPAGARVGEHWRVLGDPMAVESVAASHGVEELIVVPQSLSWESVRQIVELSSSTQNGLSARLSPGFYDILATGVRVANRADVPLLTLERARITGPDALLKACLDYSIALPLVLVIAPIWGAMALWTGIRGRRLFRRNQAVGLRGETFEMFALDRGTGVPVMDRPGSFHPGMAPTRWQKLPALLNVLLGHMSLVGPRPLDVNDLPSFERWARILLAVKPGITGPWRDGAPTPEEQVTRALYYIRHYSIWLDLACLFHTAQRLARIPELRSESARASAPPVLRCPSALPSAQPSVAPSQQGIESASVKAEFISQQQGS